MGLKIGKVIVPKLVPLPAGKFKMGGTKYPNEGPIRKVEISAFAIGLYEVTNGEYRVYLEATGQEIHKLVSDSSLARHPTAWVNWHDPVAYCEWLSKVTGRNFRLPTEAEWEYAARGLDGRKFPWGNKWDASKANFNTSGATPVDAYPEGVSPFGVIDMSGNVWEWTANWHANKYNPLDLVNPKGPKKGVCKVLRGGSWFCTNSDGLRVAYRCFVRPRYRRRNFGFRIAESLK